jgi:hypothetical protein
MLKRKKKKGFSSGGSGERNLAQSSAARAHARAPAQLRPSAGDGAGARGDDAVAVGPHASESGGEGGKRRHG